MRVLVGCEESGTVRDAFREQGHDARSCDLMQSRGETRFRMFHWQMDIVQLLRGMPDEFFDLIILFPDCTKMATSGNATYANTAERFQAVKWTIDLWILARKKAKAVALENPQSVIWPAIRPLTHHTQFVHPWWFSTPEKKATGLALWNLPRLRMTSPLGRAERAAIPSQDFQRVQSMAKGPYRARDRAVTDLNMAKAMSRQWTLEIISRLASTYPQTP